MTGIRPPHDPQPHGVPEPDAQEQRVAAALLKALEIESALVVLPDPARALIRAQASAALLPGGTVALVVPSSPVPLVLVVGSHQELCQQTLGLQRPVARLADLLTHADPPPYRLISAPGLLLDLGRQNVQLVLNRPWRPFVATAGPPKKDPGPGSPTEHAWTPFRPQYRHWTFGDRLLSEPVTEGAAWIGAALLAGTSPALGLAAALLALGTQRWRFQRRAAEPRTILQRSVDLSHGPALPDSPVLPETGVQF